VSRLEWSGWAGAAVLAICAAVGLWHHRRDAARVARCAHELRGSLGALRLGLDLALARGGLTPDRLRALDLQLSRAAAALEELDGPSGATRGKLLDAEGAVDISALARETVIALAPLAWVRGIELVLGELPAVSVAGFRTTLAQALGNLIQNAIEHGAGPVAVGVRMGEEWVRLEVADHGPGLSRPLTRLCRPARGRGWGPAATRHGHGLPLAAVVAAAHGGRLLSAPTDAGACLVLELPLRPTAAVGAPAHETWVAKDGRRRVTVAGSDSDTVPAGTLSAIRRSTGLEQLR
jgi:signal transduction histidine kinase